MNNKLKKELEEKILNKRIFKLYKIKKSNKN